ncbi:MAG: hypothetical protein AB7O66_02550 [Limisphaerales bacterium]
MNRTALVIVSSDPRTSPRPAEAVRIAAGVGAWKKVRVTLALWGPAVLALSEFPDDLVDDDNFSRYLPIIGELEQPVYVEAGAPLLGELGEAPVKFEAIDPARLARLAAENDCVLRF